MGERKGGREAVEAVAREILEQSRRGKVEVNDPVTREKFVITGKPLSEREAYATAREAARRGDARHEEQSRRGTIVAPPTPMQIRGEAGDRDPRATHGLAGWGGSKESQARAAEIHREAQDRNRRRK